MQTLRFIRHIFVKFPALLAGNVCLIVLAGLLDAVSVFSLAPLVDFILHSGLEGASALTQKVIGVFQLVGLPTTLVSVVAIFMLLNFLKSGAQVLVQYMIVKTKYAVLGDLIMGTFDDFLNASWRFFTTKKQGFLLNTFIREIAVVGNAFGAMVRFFACLLELIIYLGVPFYISWQVTSVSLISALFFAVPFLLLGPLSYRLGKANTSTANHFSTCIQETISSAKLTLGFNNGVRAYRDMNQAFEAQRRTAVKTSVLSQSIPLFYAPLGLSVLVIAMFTARGFNVPIAETAVLLYSLLKIVPTIGRLASEKNSIDNFFPSYEQVQALRRDARQLRQPTGKKSFEGFRREISFNKVMFAFAGYPPVLSDINIRIRKGKMTALVGASGAGKSTLIDLLMGFHTPSSGVIMLDEFHLSAFDIRSYRQRIGYVPQECLLFNTTIIDNLRWAREDASDEDIQKACEQANAASFINELRDGFQTIVGDRGVRLSGGQVQRIALARAILRKPELLILDEATSALDTRSERLIQQAIEEIAKTTTVVIIAHRLSTIMNADHIYVLEGGRIIEEGSYLELTRASGPFKSMVEIQRLDMEAVSP